LDSGIGFDIGASAGYAGEDAAPGGESGFQEYTITMGLGYEINGMVSVSAIWGYTDAIDDDVLPEQDVDFFGGGGIAFAF